MQSLLSPFPLNSLVLLSWAVPMAFLCLSLLFFFFFSLCSTLRVILRGWQWYSNKATVSEQSAHINPLTTKFFFKESAQTLQCRFIPASHCTLYPVSIKILWVRFISYIDAKYKRRTSAPKERLSLSMCRMVRV